MNARSGLRWVAVGLLAGGAALTLASVAEADEGGADVPLTVTVTSTPVSTGAGTSTVVPHGSASSPSGSDPAQGADGSTVAQPAAEAGGGDGPSGLVAVGGLRTSYDPSGNPFGGSLHVQASIQNLSDQTIDPTVTFSVSNALGVVVGEQDERALGAMAPGELRLAEADLGGIGQWGVVGVHMTLTPPSQIDGTAVGPVSRDRWMLAPPWFAISALALVAGGVAAWRWSARVPIPPPATVGVTP